jgi:hypothetical protein
VVAILMRQVRMHLSTRPLACLMACCLRAAHLEAQGTVIYIRIEADYLVIGADATALAFVYTLLSENTDATAVMVDRQHRPGGHWNNA